MRCILLIIDGLGDKGHTCFEGRTPLQVASTPHLDYLAEIGMNGIYHSYLQGTALPSELAHFLIFGYDISEFPGRGLIEAIGEGINVNQGEVALLARIFSVALEENRLMLKQENPPVERELCRTLQEAIKKFEQDGVEIEFIPTKGIEGILVVRGDVSAEITDSNPIYEERPLMEVVPFRGNEKDASALRTAKVINSYLSWCYRTLSEHPVNRKRCERGMFPINAVGTQRAGRKRQLNSFRDKWGLKGLSLSSGSLYHGLCDILQLDTQRMEETGNPESDLSARLKLAREAVDYDFIHVHTKAADEAAHTRNPGHKKKVIESIDRSLSYVLDEIIPDEETLVVITADHSTASAGAMIHSGETVPLTMVGKYTRRDEVGKFDETSCAGGGLGLVRGKELMYLILNFLDRGKLWGLMDSPVNQPYFPGNYKPLTVD